jgi:hypothetical protein
MNGSDATLTTQIVLSPANTDPIVLTANEAWTCGSVPRNGPILTLLKD